MNCGECRYYNRRMSEYPCSKCHDYDRFREENNSTITPDDIMMLADEIRSLRMLVEKLVEKE